MKRCGYCGNDERWCSVYTGCPLNKGNEHKLRSVCITVKKKQFKHQFVFSGIGDQRHCLFCGIDEREK